MKDKKWKVRGYFRETADEMEKAGIPVLAASVLSARGIKGASEAKEFLRSDAGLLIDPMLMEGMLEAVRRIRRAVSGGELIAVFGDYDVDGITATCLAARALEELGARYIWRVPDRIEDGYGLSVDAVDDFAAAGASLIITVDNGITCKKETDYARSLGIDLVITDHHEYREDLPEAAAVINPHRPDCGYPYKFLSGVGVAFKLASALFPELGPEELFDRYGQLAAIGTIGDVMPVTGENRAIITAGIKRMKETGEPGLSSLFSLIGVEKRRITSGFVGYTLSPRLNAAGRMGRASDAAELIMAGSRERADELSDLLCALNAKRREIESSIYNEAVSMVTAEYGDEPPNVILLDKENWHQGVIGIVASRLAERYACPAFLICREERGRGSARGFGSFNLYRALSEAREILENFGGHEHAAGFTIDCERIPEFYDFMCRYIREHRETRMDEPTLEIDCEIDADVMTMRNVAALDILEPYGSGNSKPVFCTSGMTLSGITAVGAGKHLRLTFEKSGTEFGGIYFSPESFPFSEGDCVDAAYTLEINTFRNISSVQLVVSGVRLSENQAEIDNEGISAYNSFQVGKAEPEKLPPLIPRRDDFVAVWRAVKREAERLSAGVGFRPFARRAFRDAGLFPSSAKLLFCLDVLHEYNLINYSLNGDNIRVFISDSSEKVDLSASKILLRLKESVRGD